MATESDPYATAKDNIRETVKWLVATFAALAAFVAGSSPLTGLGGLPLGSGRFLIAVAALMIAFAAICHALKTALGILRQDAIYRSELLHGVVESDRNRTDRDEIERQDAISRSESPHGVAGSDRSRADRNEIERVRKEIEAHAADLLPYNYRSLKELANASNEAWEALGATPKAPVTDASREARKEAVAGLDALHDVMLPLMQLAQYLRLQFRLKDALPRLFVSGMFALIGLVAYGAMVNPPAPEKAAPARIVVVEQHVRRDPRPPPPEVALQPPPRVAAKAPANRRPAPRRDCRLPAPAVQAAAK